jgi:glyceraldehyde 3-phosphate dehydrogenase
MKTKIAINGFGRIGRNAFKIAFERPDLEIVAVNDPSDVSALAHLLLHDTNYGKYDKKVEVKGKDLIVDGKHIKVYGEREPEKLPWKELDIDVVVECTGFFTQKDGAGLHIKAGAKRVVISAPTKSEDVPTIVIGANEGKLDASSEIISNASCTTNSIAAVMSILDEAFGIEKAMLTTVHSYTASQRLLDASAKDFREGRNAANNLVPTSTGAAIAVGLTVPQVQGKFDGLSIRVPTPVVSISDVTILFKKDVTKEGINDLFKKVAKDPYYQGIVGINEEPLVSSDFVGNSHSGIVDLLLTNVVGGNLAKVVVWYDNEWGYANRLVELVADTGKLLHNKS